MEKVEIAEAVCPSCSPDEPTTHSILKKGGLVKCEECGYVHAIPVKKKKLIKLRVVVSRQDKSSVQFVEVDEDELIHTGDEFVVESGDEVSGVRVQSIETKTKARPDMAVASEVDTLWARTIDEVIVKIAVQEGPITESVHYKVSGDHEFDIGGIIHLKGYDVAVVSIKTREGAHAKREGQFVKAKDITRIYSKIVSRERPAGRGGGFKLRSRKAYRGTGDEEA